MIPAKLQYALPDWLAQFIKSYSETFSNADDQMRFVIDLARKNIEHNTGGPFAAAVFHKHSRKLVSVGINLVTTCDCSVLHAEVLAIMLAQSVTHRYDLSDQNYELVTSAQPCDMCMGAIRWSGIRQLICGARREDVEEIGFVESIGGQWCANDLKKYGFVLICDVLRKEACQVLSLYVSKGGLVYNPDSVTELKQYL